MKQLLRAILGAAIVLLAPFSGAAPPQTINYQGYLTNNASVPVNASVNVTFRLYTVASGGSPVWTESQSGIGVANGIFNAVLGSATALNLPFDAPYFLSLQVNSDAEMALRQPLSAAPYAMRAGLADAMAAGAVIPAAQITGTIASGQFAATQLLPITACAANQFSQWNGAAWVCAAGTGTSTTSDVSGNLTMLNSTAGAGNILKGGVRFLHNYGSQSTFIGEGAGNFTMTGGDNTATGWNALRINVDGFDNTAHGTRALYGNTTGSHNTASGRSALRDNSSGFNNTAGGADALMQNTTGDNNTASGTLALYKNLTGSANTASGSNALYNSTGSNNTALGAGAGVNLTTGSNNIHVGNEGLAGEAATIKIGTTGIHSKAHIAGVLGVTPGIGGDVLLPVVVAPNGQLGTLAAFPPGAQGPAGPTGPQGPIGPTGPQGPAGSSDIPGNLTMVQSTATTGNIMKGANRFIHNFGIRNEFFGGSAGNFTMTGADNLGVGGATLFANTSGSENTAVGELALRHNGTGSTNTAVGKEALFDNVGGSGHIALGYKAGSLVTSGFYNIHIGNSGASPDSNTIRIGNALNHTATYIAGIRGTATAAANAIPVLIDSNGQLGTASSSRRFKDNIADMNAASGALMKLRPVTFHYKSDQNASGRALQYGLIAEEVAEIYPGLVARSADGEIETVMYQFLPPMLLNEVQKQSRAIESLQILVESKDREIDGLRRDLDAIKRKLGLD